jgi:[ribosomal protein S18]-alanine N-acetyltransferase
VAGNNIEIRNYDLKDLPEILKIEKKAHTNPWSEEFFSKQFSGSTRALLSLEDNQVLGYLVYQQVLDEAEVLNLVTCVERQNQGYASRLLNQFLMSLEPYQVKRVYLEVASDNLAAIALYTKYLFEPHGIRKDYYKRENYRCNAILMSRRLE